MNKRLILVMAAVLTAGLTYAAYAEVQNVKVGGDITAYGLSRNMNIVGPNNDATENAAATIARVRIDADLTDNVGTTVRLLNERYWGKEVDNLPGSGENTNIDLDLAFVTLKEFLYSPLSVIVGRQELHFGNDMIVGDVDTNNICSAASPFGANNRDKDLSARKAFDAIRATLNYDPLVIDAIAALVEDTNLNTSDDVNLFGVNANYKLADMQYMKNNVVEAYWFQKRTGRDNTATAVTRKAVDKINVLGGRLSTQPIEDLTYSLEAAYQFGKYVGRSVGAPIVRRKAWALETALNYNFKNLKCCSPSVTALYAFFSGDPTNNGYTTFQGASRAWDPMYENQKFGDIANALFNQSNAHVAGGNLMARPMEDIGLKGEYYAFWWVYPYQGDGIVASTARQSSVNLKTTAKKFAGQELDLTATYDYTEDVQFALMGGWFFPGKAWDKANRDTASEVIGSMKVTF